MPEAGLSPLMTQGSAPVSMLADSNQCWLCSADLTGLLSYLEVEMLPCSVTDLPLLTVALHGIYIAVASCDSHACKTPSGSAAVLLQAQGSQADIAWRHFVSALA